MTPEQLLCLARITSLKERMHGFIAAYRPEINHEALGRVSHLEAALREVAEFAHDKSTGPAVPDALWEIRAKAYAALDSGPPPHDGGEVARFTHNLSSKTTMTDEQLQPAFTATEPAVTPSAPSDEFTAAYMAACVGRAPDHNEIGLHYFRAGAALKSVQPPAPGAAGPGDALTACRTAFAEIRAHCWPFPLSNDAGKSLSMEKIDKAMRLVDAALAARKGTGTATSVGPVQEVAFPPRILALLRDVADRNSTATHGPFEDGNGQPLQDDADAALAWIASHAMTAPPCGTVGQRGEKL